MKKILLFSLLCNFCWLLEIFAVPAKRNVATVRMSDGTEQVIQLRGDETFHFHTTLDGVPVCKNEDGTWSKDTRDVHALWTEALTKRNKHRQKLSERTRRQLAPRRAGEVTNTKKGLLILVNFTDKKMVNGDNSQSLFDQMLNGLNNPYGQNYGSVREYFRAQSYGHFDITFDIVGPVTVSQEMSYYGGNDNQGNDKAPEKMVVEACMLIDDQVNFSDYDWDGDGEVENIYVVYAGYGEASFPDGDKVGENTIWPHQWNLTESTGAPLTLDGVKIDTYACGSELYGASGSEIDGIGTMCHEYSHCLGLPDFYDTETWTNYGMCSWSIMDAGCYVGDGFCPVGYTAYERWFCGWLEPMVLKEACNVNDLKNIENYPEAYVIYNDANKNEYYLLANHQQTGWDTYSYGHGMMITHVDYDASAWENKTINNTASRQRMTIIPADNVFSKNEYGYYYSDDGDLWPGTSGNKALTDTSTPVAILYNKNSDGQKLMHKPIENITEENGVISFLFMGGTPIDAPIATEATDIKPSAFTANWTPVEKAVNYNLMLTETFDDGQEEEKNYIDALNLYEDFQKFTSTSDGAQDISNKLDDYTLISGWMGTKVFQGVKGAKIASITAMGDLTTPLLEFNSGTATVIMTVCNYNDDDSSPKLICLDDDEDEIMTFSVEPEEDMYLIFDLTENVPNSMKLKISTEAGKRIYVGDMYVFDMTLTEKQLSDFINNELNSPTHNYRRVNKSISKSTPQKAIVTTSQVIEGLTGTSFIVTGCKPNSSYTYKAQAVDAEGNASYWSNVISVTTPADYGVSVTAYSYTIEYGDQIPSLEFISEGKDIEGEPAITCEVVQGSPVGTYPIVISQGSITTDNVNYVNGTLTITKAPLTITVNNATRKQGEPNPQFTVTYSGFKNGETEEVLTQKPVATTTADLMSGPGTYPITVSGGAAENYELNYVSGTLTVTQVLHTATITCIGNGVVTCHDYASDEDVTIKDAEMTSVRFSQIDGLDLSILPDLGYQLMRLMVSNIDRTEDVDDEGHIHLDAHGDLNIIAQFVPQSEVVVSVNDAKYRIPDLSTDEAEVAGINKAAAHVTIPATVDYRGRTWRITKVADGAFASCQNLVSISIPASVKEAGTGLFEGDTHLAAIEWNSDIPLTRTLLGTLRNPNLLYYVKQKELAEGFSNVITGSNESGWQAEQIQLTDNDAVIHDFYAPKPFTAQRISYTHAYLQETNKGECRGWESLVLPFDVQTITHQKGEIKPFLAYHLTAEDALPDSYLPFWLYEFTEEGQFRAAEAVRANTPYILSMPNDDHNDPHYDLSGSVTFKAENAEVKASQDAVTVTGNGRTFRPAYQERLTGEGCYVLNVGKTHAGLVEGSVFVRNLRDVRPFEAYFTVDGGAVKEDFFSVFDKTTDIADLFGNDVKDNHANEAVYDLAGRKMNGKTVKAGLYIINGQKRLTK